LQRKYKIFLTKKIQNIFERSISKKLVVKDFFKKEDVPQKEFLEDLGLLIAKNDLLIQFVESIWLYIYVQN
jgi:hypothetical protein